MDTSHPQTSYRMLNMPGVESFKRRKTHLKCVRETLNNATRISAIYRFCFTKFMREMLRSVFKRL